MRRLPIIPARFLVLLCAWASATAAEPHAGEGWDGLFTIVPMSAPRLVLGAGDGALADGARVALAAPADPAARRWRVTANGDGTYAISPAESQTLVLAVAGGGTANATPVVLETAAGKPSQAWRIGGGAGGPWTLVPKHAPGKGLDDFGGADQAGARQDLWDLNPGDEHLQWVLRPLAGATVPPGYLDPLSIARGEIKEFTFTASKVFPGTKRSGTLFIPAQYDGSAPACVYVRQDGYNAREKGMLEALIAAKEMPVTIGVFIRPGDLPAPMPGTLGRRNRCFEYDGVGDAYARFLVDELLPWVAATYSLKLSESGNDRCIAGGSSGGIAAFNAAWERPEAFSRVYANSGSFVAFRGGHEFPTLIRKCEARPIRAYLTTGTHDMENCAGDWFLLDQEVDKALRFSGYDYSFHALEGGHVAGWNEHFADAMRFIWKDWPAAVKPGASAPRVRDVIAGEAGWERVAFAGTDARAPACGPTGEVFFLAGGGRSVQCIGLDGRIATVVPDAGQADGLTISASGEIIAVSARTGQVTGHPVTGPARVIAEGAPGRFALARPDGGIYVAGGTGLGGKLWLLQGGQRTALDSGVADPTGLAYRPDQWLLAVGDGRSRWAWSMAIAPDGTLTDKERFFHLEVADQDDDAGVEGICYAREGQLLLATRLGVQVCADDGPAQVILPVPDHARVLGVCLGGPGMTTLYAFCGGAIWKRAAKIHAMGAFTPWTKVGGTPL